MIHVGVLDLEQLRPAGAASGLHDQLYRLTDMRRGMVKDGLDVFDGDLKVPRLFSLQHPLTPVQHRILFDVLERHAEVEDDVQVGDIAVERAVGRSP
jgi:hypothetical protein